MIEAPNIASIRLLDELEPTDSAVDFYIGRDFGAHVDQALHGCAAVNTKCELVTLLITNDIGIPVNHQNLTGHAAWPGDFRADFAGIHTACTDASPVDRYRDCPFLIEAFSHRGDRHHAGSLLHLLQSRLPAGRSQDDSTVASRHYENGDQEHRSLAGCIDIVSLVHHSHSLHYVPFLHARCIEAVSELAEQRTWSHLQ